MKFVSILLKLLFVVFVIAYAVTFYLQYQLVGLSSVNPATLNDPVQNDVTNSAKIEFKTSKYEYVATPIYDYKITGVVVSKRDYNPPEGDIEEVVRYDLCIVWGKNVADNIYLSPKVTFTQSQRFCNYRYTENVGLHYDQISNSHLVTTDKSILEVLATIERGDEVTINGRLINMVANGNYGNPDALKYMTWNSSTTRKDNEAGACEVIYVDSIRILNQAHKTSKTINNYALEGIAVLLMIGILRFIWFIIFTKPKKTNLKNR